MIGAIRSLVIVATLFSFVAFVVPTWYFVRITSPDKDVVATIGWGILFGPLVLRVSGETKRDIIQAEADRIHELVFAHDNAVWIITRILGAVALLAALLLFVASLRVNTRKDYRRFAQLSAAVSGLSFAACAMYLVFGNINERKRQCVGGCQTGLVGIAYTFLIPNDPSDYVFVESLYGYSFFMAIVLGALCIVIWYLSSLVSRVGETKAMFGQDYDDAASSDSEAPLVQAAVEPAGGVPPPTPPKPTEA